MRRILLVILLLSFVSIASAATRFDDEGVNQGYINALDCVGTNITCTRSGITGTLTIGTGAPEVDLIPPSGNSFEIYADTNTRLWITNRTTGAVLLGFLADGSLFAPNLACNGANTFVTSRGGNLICASVAGSAGGTVTSITAGNQLTGGTITTSGTIAVSTTPSFASLTLSAGTPQLQLTPSAGNAHELYDFNSEVFLTNTTTGQVLLAFDAAGAPFLPGLTCSGTNTVVNITSTGRLLCGSGSGSGTVTSITAGTGLGGGTITTSGTISLTTPVTVANGGTGNTTNTLNGVLYGNAGSAVLVTSQGPTNSVLTASAGAPSFSATPTITTATATSDFDLVPASGNSWEWSGATSVLYLTNRTNGNQLLQFDALDRFFLPQITTCDNAALKILLNGRVTCGTINLATTQQVTGTLPVGNGGTGATTLTTNGVLYGNGTGAVSLTAQGAANTVLTANAGAPSFSATPTLTSLTLSATTPQIQLTPSSGSAHEIYDSNSELYIADTTNTRTLMVFDIAGRPLFPQLTCTGGNVLTATASGRLLCVSAGTGTVTSITAGTGLSGGTITTSGTINISTALLSAAHTDTVAAGPTRGDLIIANSTPAWARFAVGGTNTVLTANATDPSWSNSPTVTQANATSDIDWNPASGDQYEANVSNSVFSLSDKTLALPFLQFTKAGQMLLPQMSCTNNTVVTLTSQGLLQCIAVTASATPAGSNTQVQYNNSGATGGSSGITLNSTQVTAFSSLNDTDWIPASGNSFEIYGNNNVWYGMQRTSGAILWNFGADNSFYLPQTGNCTGIATFNTNGKMSCTTVAAGAAKTTKYIPMALSTVYTQNSNMFWTATNGTNFDYGTYSFLKAVTGQSFWYVPVPNDIATTTNWNVVLYSKSKSGAAANVVVTLKCKDRADNVAWDGALTALTTTKVVALYTSANLNITTLNPLAAGYDSLLTLTAGDMLVCEVDRVGGNAGDTLQDDWQLVSPPVLKVDVN